MLRKLLTLFVLLSGLAAAGAPAQARIAALDEVRLEAPSGFASPCAVAGAQEARHYGQLPLVVQRSGNICPRPTATVIIRVPTVMFGADRAHE